MPVWFCHAYVPVSTYLYGLSLECQGALPTQRRVAAQIVEPIDILEYRAFGLAFCFPTITPDHLSFNGFEEYFDHVIVITIPFATH